MGATVVAVFAGFWGVLESDNDPDDLGCCKWFLTWTFAFIRVGLTALSLAGMIIAFTYDYEVRLEDKWNNSTVIIHEETQALCKIEKSYECSGWNESSPYGMCESYDYPERFCQPILLSTVDSYRTAQKVAFIFLFIFNCVVTFSRSCFCEADCSS
jgi:hypothetical protein